MITGVVSLINCISQRPWATGIQIGHCESGGRWVDSAFKKNELGWIEEISLFFIGNSQAL